jgi:hypothetical protein
MASVNDDLRDFMLSHRLGLNRYSNAVNADIQRLLFQTHLDLRRQLRQRLFNIDVLGRDRGPITTIRVKNMINQSKQMLVDGMADAHSALVPKLEELAAYEQQYLKDSIRKAVPSDIPLAITLSSPELLNSIVTSKPMQGRLLGDHFKKLGARSGTAAKALEQSIKVGLAQGKTIEQIVRQVDAKALRLMRHNVAAVVHTAVSHVTGSMRQQVGQDNPGIVKGYQWLSTLDNRTTLEWCIPRDGHTYDLNYEPTSGGPPWLEGPGMLHWNCRSDSTYVLKSWKELGIKAKELSGQTRASMTGQVPRETTAKQFFEKLLKDPVQRQRLMQLHGAKMIQLVENGTVSLDDLARISARTKKAVTLKALAKEEGIDIEKALAKPKATPKPVPGSIVKSQAIGPTEAAKAKAARERAELAKKREEALAERNRLRAARAAKEQARVEAERAAAAEVSVDVPRFKNVSEAEAWIKSQYGSEVVDFAGASLADVQIIADGLASVLGNRGHKVGRIGWSQKGKQGLNAYYQRPTHLNSTEALLNSTDDVLGFQKSYVKTKSKVKATRTRHTRYMSSVEREIISLEDKITQFQMMADAQSTPGAKQSFLHSIASMEKKVAKLKNIQRWSVSSTADVPLLATTTHEAAHVVYYQGSYRAPSGALSTVRDAWKKGLKKLSDEGRLLPGDAVSLSEYGASRQRELWAEVGGAIHSGQAGYVPRVLIDLYEEIMQGYSLGGAT